MDTIVLETNIFDSIQEAETQVILLVSPQIHNLKKIQELIINTQK